MAVPHAGPDGPTAATRVPPGETAAPRRPGSRQAADGARRRPPRTGAAEERPTRPALGWAPWLLSPAWRRAVLLVPVVAFALLAWQHRWMQEDGFINLRIVEQVRAGHGPVFNAGERVEAFTSPLWLGVLVALRLLIGWLVPLEWIAVGAGIALAILGVAGVQAGAARLQAGRRRPRPLVPAGVLVVVAVPAMWDFASSGLETGLAMGWIGACMWALARVARPRRSEGERSDGMPAPPPTLGSWGAVLIGLGPLIRPELLLYSVSFAVAVWRLSSLQRSGGIDRSLVVRRAGAFLAAPLAYQLFRMGFFAAVLPNTALAKDAAGSVWGRGLRYAWNFAGPYVLAVPAVALLATLALSRPDKGNRPWRVVATAMLVPALLNVLYVIKVGGDYMHGRFLVVPLLALVAPVAVVPLRRRNPVELSAQATLVGCVAVWAVVCAFGLRPPIAVVRDGALQMEDQHAAVVRYTHHAYPVRARDQPDVLVRAGLDIRRNAEGDVLWYRRDLTDATGRALPRPPGTGPMATNNAIGVPGYMAGPDVTLVDVLGLADPVASRLPGVASSRAGHNHSLGPPWLAARTDAAFDPLPLGSDAARRALRCGALGRYLGDVSRPLTVRRFLGNVVHAVANTTIRVPADPAGAEAKFCGH